MKNKARLGFTTLELIIAAAIIAVLGTAAYLFSISSNQIKQIAPTPTKSPTTLTITHNNELNAANSGYTVKVNDTDTANAILDDITRLSPVPKGQPLVCANDTGDTYILHFTEPVETFNATYGGCNLVTQSGGSSRLATGQTGKVFWSDVAKATGRPL